MNDYTIEELEKWDERIKKLVSEHGLDPFPQIFEFCDHDQMIGYMSYSGMPSRYPHWSFGKHFEKQKMFYNLGIGGLPYEMVINSNPSLAYLVEGNSLTLQILIMAHVYAHNDFFRNNATFRETHPEYTLEKFKAHANRIRKYSEHPEIGFRAVEDLLDAAHAISMNCRRSGSDEKDAFHRGRKLPRKQEDKCECGGGCGKAKKEEEKDSEDTEFTPKGYGDLLLFIRDNNRRLTEWEKDALTIVHEETRYFIPQIETKIMNEGWASYWHKTILDELDLPQELRMEFMVRHNQVLRPIPGSLNPYYMGFKIYENIRDRWDNPSDEERSEYGREGGQGLAKIFQVRESDRDEAFLRQYLTPDIMREMHLFQHEKVGNQRVVTKVASDQDWMQVKETIIKGVGMNSYPVIKAYDADFERKGQLLLKHDFDGRALDRDYTSKTLKHVAQLWGAPVILETFLNDKRHHYIFDNEAGSLQIKEVQ